MALCCFWRSPAFLEARDGMPESAGKALNFREVSPHAEAQAKPHHGESPMALHLPLAQSAVQSRPVLWSPVEPFCSVPSPTWSNPAEVCSVCYQVLSISQSHCAPSEDMLGVIAAPAWPCTPDPAAIQCHLSNHSSQIRVRRSSLPVEKMDQTLVTRCKHTRQVTLNWEPGTPLEPGKSAAHGQIFAQKSLVNVVENWKPECGHAALAGNSPLLQLQTHCPKTMRSWTQREEETDTDLS
ncbi:uncharacterized protein LOC104684826 [Corvus cornix cornix]|uniref:uncharacterized protein LOC104684826 n=1 Tax=Corvus cornix cornix TaxID=932674 RepID=UPI000534C9B8|nr:uncharacterized protein LOC104684826 [Corvus cornix cornix]